MTLSRSQGTPKVSQVLLGCSALFSLDSEGIQAVQQTRGMKEHDRNKEFSMAREGIPHPSSSSTNLKSSAALPYQSTEPVPHRNSFSQYTTGECHFQ